jgi:hypothetical protein
MYKLRTHDLGRTDYFVLGDHTLEHKYSSVPARSRSFHYGKRNASPAAIHSEQTLGKNKNTLSLPHSFSIPLILYHLLQYTPNISIFLFLGINGSFSSLNASKLTRLSHSLVHPHTLHATPSFLLHLNINSSSILQTQFDYPTHNLRPHLQAIAVQKAAVSFCRGPEQFFITSF